MIESSIRILKITNLTLKYQVRILEITHITMNIRNDGYKDVMLNRKRLLTTEITMKMVNRYSSSNGYNGKSKISKYWIFW